MKSWLIKKLGGYTAAEYDALQGVWDDAVSALTEQDRVTVLGDYSVLQQAHIDGALIVAPRSYAFVSGCYSDRTYLPVDRESRIH
jgi:hypothetical protein